MTATHWDVYPRLTRDLAGTFQQTGISYLHAQLLYNRGIHTPEAMRRFLGARYDQLLDPFLLTDMGLALERIGRALATREHVTVFGDFDADGVTSAALILHALRMLKHPDAELDCYIPHRTQDARGLSQEALEQIAARGTSLVITTDCGSSDTEAVAYARTLGIDIIITDHHQPPEQLPQAYAMINPWRPDSTYPERYLCGVGIAFKLVQALFGAEQREQEAQSWLDLVTVGTVADVAQLLGENHTLARLGLQRLNDTSNPGLRALIQVAGLRLGEIGERDIAFALAPRLNAAGRMQHADSALQLLVTDDRNEAGVLAWKLEELNRLRKEQTDVLMARVREQAQDQASEPVILICGEQGMYPEGIIGLAAGKLAEEVKRPVFLLSRDTTTSRGSARSYGGLDLIEALQACAELFVHYGGHTQAAGFTIANTSIEALREHLLAWFTVITSTRTDAAPATGTKQGHSLQESRRMVDLVIARPEALNYSLYVSIDQLSPFGAGYPVPVFEMDNLHLTHCWTSGPDGGTLQVRLQSGAVQFKGSYKGGGRTGARFEAGSLVNVIFSLAPALKRMEWEDQQDIWLQVLQMEAATGA